MERNEAKRSSYDLTSQRVCPPFQTSQQLCAVVPGAHCWRRK